MCLLENVIYLEPEEIYEQYVTSNALCSTLLLTSPSMLDRSPSVKQISEKVQQAGGCVCTDISPNPDTKSLFSLIEKYKQCHCEVILAIGGGSVIDTAKCLAAFCPQKEKMDYDKFLNCLKTGDYLKNYKAISIVAIPTTAGTGAEMTKWGTIWDFASCQKYSVQNTFLYPKEVYLCASLTKSLSPRLTLATGLDALCHAMESFWAKASTPLAKQLAISSLSIIKEFLPLVLENPKHICARTKMLTASTMAGMAISISRTTACHAISYPLLMNYGIEHGFAAALTLKPVLSINYQQIPQLCEVTDIFGGFSGFENWLNHLTEPIQPLKLHAFSDRNYDLKKIAQSSNTKGRMDNNPISLHEKDIIAILESIL